MLLMLSLVKHSSIQALVSIIDVFEHASLNIWVVSVDGD